MFSVIPNLSVSSLDVIRSFHCFVLESSECSNCGHTHTYTQSTVEQYILHIYNLYRCNNLRTYIFYCLTEFSCIRRTYFLLYQSLIPNCKMTIAILRQHCEITSDVEKYILNRGSARLCCQQLLNFLLVRLDKSKDYMEFCRFLQLTSVLSNLSAKMISGTEVLHVMYMLYM